MKRYAGLLVMGIMGAACSEPAPNMNESQDMSTMQGTPDLASPVDLLPPPPSLSLVAGGLGGAGSGDGLGADARWSSVVRCVRSDKAGNLYVADANSHTIRKVVAASGAVTTLAGTAGQMGSTDGTGAAARFNSPFAVAPDGAGNLYVTDLGSHTIRKVVLATGVVTTLAGTAGMTGTTDGTGAAARFNNPYGLVADAGGSNLYVADLLNHTIRKVVVATGAVTTLVGSPAVMGTADGTGTAARFTRPAGLVLDSTGILYVADSNNHTVRKVVVATGVVTTLAGAAGVIGSADGTAAARFNRPVDVALDSAGALYVADSNNHTIRKVATATGDVTTLAGSAGVFGSIDGTGLAARFNTPLSLDADGTGNVYVVDAVNALLRKVGTAMGDVTTLAGSSPKPGSTDGTGAVARFNNPVTLTADGAGNLYVFDYMGHAIRKVVAATGAVTTLAGTAGTLGTADGTGSDARFNRPSAGVLDGAGNLYVADQSNHTIRKVVVSTGVVTTVAGTAGMAGSLNGTGTAARFNGPTSLAFDGAGNLYVADLGNHVIRKMVVATGVVTTLAGTAGTFGTTDGTGTAALFYLPAALALDGAGNLYVSDSGSATIRKVVVSTGVVTTFAGTAGMPGSTDGTGTAARFISVASMSLDGAGNLYAADPSNSAIRKIQTQSGVVTTVVGGPGQRGVRLGQLPARLNLPQGVAALPTGELYITDENSVLLAR